MKTTHKTTPKSMRLIIKILIYYKTGLNATPWGEKVYSTYS